MTRAGLLVGLVLAVVLVLAALALAPSSAPGVVVDDYPLCAADGYRVSPGWNEAVKLYCYKLDSVSGKWVLKKAVWCKTVDYLSYSKYRVTIYLGATGVWKLRAVAPEDTLHAATWSTSHYVTVK